jgi:hypothetical protein
MNIFEKEYDGESIVDMGRDVHEAFEERFNPIMNQVPCDEHGIYTGTFKVTIQWVEE